MRRLVALAIALPLVIGACRSAATPGPGEGQAGGGQTTQAVPLPTPMTYKDLVNRATCWETWTGDIFCIKDPQ